MVQYISSDVKDIFQTYLGLLNSKIYFQEQLMGITQKNRIH